METWKCLLFPILALFFAQGAWGQAIGSLRGTVTDPQGAAVLGAEVLVRNEETGATRATTSGPDGVYLFPQLAPGTHTVEVKLSGFKTAIRRKVEILVATPATLDVALELGVLRERVEVTAAPTAINTADASLGDTFGETKVKQLPLSARNAVALLTLQPGVIFTGESDLDLLSMGSTTDLKAREGVVNGVRSNQTNVTLDGVDVNDAERQAAFTSALPVTLDSLQEFRVVTSNANAYAGVAAGAQVELVTKSGTNELHGNVRWFHRNDATAATPFFTNASGLSKPKQIRNQYGFSLGGPLRRNRAFFFLDWEQRRDNSESLELRQVPSDFLKSGIFTYHLDDTAPGFDPNAPGIIPCPNNPGRFCRQLGAAGIAAIDPAGLGTNPAMLAYMSQFPSGNAPAEAFDGGLNWNALRFNAPVQVRNNIYTARLDFRLDGQGNHTVYWRGSLGDIKHQIDTPSNFPGQPVAGDFLNNSKGFSARYNAAFGSTSVNTFTWGFTRAGIEQSGQKGDLFNVRFFDPHKAFNRAFGRRIPTHHISNDLTWIQSRHTLQMGTNLRFTRNHRFSEERSFPTYLVNLGLCSNFCREPLDTLLADGDPNNNPADFLSFVSSYLMLTGSITTVLANFFVDPNTLSFLPFGTPQARSFAENDLEFYFQDSWRLKPNLTLTVGIRYSYFGPVWEQNGLQVRPALDVGDWWAQRVVAAERGLPTDTVEPLSFILAGKVNDAPAWYDPDRNNWAPRLALAWSPGFKDGIGRFFFGDGGKSSVRVGAGVFFHRVGGALAVSNDSFGSPGLGNFLANPVNQFGLADAPRFTGTCTAEGCTGLPPLNIYLTIATPTFPATPSLATDNAGFLVDNDLRSPYSVNVSSSIQREIKGITFEAAYVGTLGRQLLTKTDFAQVMLNFRDPGSGMPLEEAFNRIVDLIGPDPFNPRIDPSGPGVFTIPAIPFFENTMPNLAGRFRGGNATQEFYFLATLFAPSWTDVLFLLDVNLPLAGFSPWRTGLDPEGNGLPGLGVPGRVLFQQQFGGLTGWINWGSSSYHSLQLSARRAIGNLALNANYVFSKSIDNGSFAENADFISPFVAVGQIPNPLRPKAHRAVSDFDLRHNFNANWVVELPFGSGRRFGSNASGTLERLIGGWQVAGTWRWRSGFPLSPANGFFFPTNFGDPGFGTAIGPLTSSVTRNVSGRPNLFSDPEAARMNIAFTRPGAVGSRNVIRSDDFFNIDLGIAKTFALGEKARLQFRWEAFNVFNTVNFDTDPGGSVFPVFNNLDPTAPTIFGRFTDTAGGFPQRGAREMQFVLRLDF